jgi:hypothetical protein
MKDLKIDVKSVGKFGEEILIRITHIPTKKFVVGTATHREHDKLVRYLVDKIKRMLRETTLPDPIL